MVEGALAASPVQMSPGKGYRAVSMGLDGTPGANPSLQLGLRGLRKWQEGHPSVCIQGLGLLPWTLSGRKAQITHLGCLVGQVPWQNHFKSIGLLENMSSDLSPPGLIMHVSPCVSSCCWSSLWPSRWDQRELGGSAWAQWGPICCHVGVTSRIWLPEIPESSQSCVGQADWEALHYCYFLLSLFFSQFLALQTPKCS